MQRSDVMPIGDDAPAQDRKTGIRNVRMRNAHWRRVVINAVMFVVVVVFLGWVNVAAMWLVEKATGVEISIDDIIADGSLFFYSITLLGGSLYSMFVMLQRGHPIEFGFVAALLLFICVLLGAAYLTSINDYLYIEHHGSWKPPMDLLVTWEKRAAWVAMGFAFLSNLAVDICENQIIQEEGKVEASVDY